MSNELGYFNPEDVVRNAVELMALSPEQYLNQPVRIVFILNLGIAIGSVVKMEVMLSIDNGIIYRAVVVAEKVGLVNASIVMGYHFL
jgi:uncharacterized ferredoxin-like protein